MSLSYPLLAKQYYDKLINPEIENEKKAGILTALEAMADSKEINCPEAKFYFYKYAMAQNNAIYKQKNEVLPLTTLIILFLKEFNKENYLVNNYLLPITDCHNKLTENEKYYPPDNDHWTDSYQEATPLYKTYLAFFDETKLLIESKINNLLATTINQPELEDLLNHLKAMMHHHTKMNIYDLIFNNFHHLIQGNYRYFSDQMGKLLYSQKSQLTIYWFEKSKNYLMQARTCFNGFNNVSHWNWNLKADYYKTALFYFKALTEGSISDKYLAGIELKKMADEGSVDAVAAYGKYFVHELKNILAPSQNIQEFYKIAATYIIQGANSIFLNEDERHFLVTSPYSSMENYFEIANKLNLLSSEIDKICRFEQTNFTVLNSAYHYLLTCLNIHISAIQARTAILHFDSKQKTIVDNICKLAESGCPDAIDFMGYYLYQNKNEFDGKEFHTQSVTPKGGFICFHTEDRYYDNFLSKSNCLRITTDYHADRIENEIGTNIRRNTKSSIVYLAGAEFSDFFSHFDNHSKYDSPPKLMAYDWFEKNKSYLMMAKCCQKGLLAKIAKVENKISPVSATFDNGGGATETTLMSDVENFKSAVDWEGKPTTKRTTSSFWNEETITYTVTGKRKAGIKSYTYQQLPPDPQTAIALYSRTIAESPLQDKLTALSDLKEMAYEEMVEAQEAYLSGVRQVLADLTQERYDPVAHQIKYTLYLEAVAYIESVIYSHPSPSSLFLARFLTAYPINRYSGADKIFSDCIQGHSRLKSFIVDLDNKQLKAKTFQLFAPQHSKSDQSSDSQAPKIKPTFNLDQLKLKAEKNDVIALCQLVQHFADKRTRMEKIYSQAALTENIGAFANREHSHFTAESYWLQLLYTTVDHSLSLKEKKVITLLAEEGNAAAKLLLIQEIVTQESSSTRERLQAQTDLAQVMQWGGKIFDSVCEKIYEDQSYVTKEFYTCLEKAGCFENLSLSASMALPGLAS